MKKEKFNKFSYLTKDGKMEGFFDVYQAINGGIYIMMGNRYTLLTKKQVEDLMIDIYSLNDFNYKCFKDFYRRLK